MILGMSTGKHNEISVQDIGMTGKTVADGLAVGRASGFVGKVMEPFMSGCYTLSDERMYALLAQLADSVPKRNCVTSYKVPTQYFKYF